MKWKTLLRRREPKITVENTYEEIRAAVATGKITVAYAFGLTQEKNRRAQLARSD